MELLCYRSYCFEEEKNGSVEQNRLERTACTGERRGPLPAIGFLAFFLRFKINVVHFILFDVDYNSYLNPN